MTTKSVGLAMALAIGVAGGGSFPSQPVNLAPRDTDGGVLFQCYAPDAKTVYLAGDFNDWAHNDGGRITDAQFAMEGPDTNSVWRKVLKLDPGVHRFKFNLNGAADGWFAPESVGERDGDSNAVFRVTALGNVIVRSARNAKWKPQPTAAGILFQLCAPDAHIVYLAGSFNNWADNRDGLVSDPKYAMQGPDAEGVWRKELKLPPGRQLYQFVVDGDQWRSDPNAEETDAEHHSVVGVK